MTELAILCVDDENTIINALTQEIKNIVADDIIIEVALNGDDALEIAQELQDEGVELALVISDAIMPGMQGDKLLEKLHQLYPHTYKVMLTGQAEISSIQYAINNAKLYRYLTKPWTKEDMRLTVESALEGYKNHLELESYKKELEEKVQQRTTELQNTIALVHEYTYYTLIDQNGIIAKTSDSFAGICGIPAQEIIGKSIFETFAEDTPKEILDAIDQTLSNLTKYQCEIQQQYKEFPSTWMDMTITPIFDENMNKSFFNIQRQNINDKKYIEQLVDTDVLTEIFNRRFFNSIFPKEIQRVQRDKSSFSFMMIDVDHFKKYNDTCGHQKGDEALKHVASILKNITRRGSDFAFRLGGEEFGIITSGLTQEEVLALANGINEKLYNKQIEHTQNSASKYLSCSIGVVFYEEGNITDPADTIIKSADELLYQAKDQGRNQVILQKR